VVKALIAGGADVNARSKVIPNREPYQIESSNIFGGSYEPGVYFPKTTGGFTPLLFAAQQGDLESAQALIAGGAKVDDPSPEDGTPLIVAAHSGREKLAMFLLDKGANPRATDAFGITALHYALYGGLRAIMGMPRRETDRFGWLRENQPELVKALLLKGADPNARIGKNFPTYDYAPIARSIGNDHPQLSMVGITPYMLAAASGDVAMMRTLVEGRGDPKLQTPEKITGMMVAAGFGAERNMRNEEKALEALKLAVDLGGDVNETKEDGRTALHAAAYMGWNSVVEFLVSKGANIEAKDIYGQTPLTVAMGDPEGLIYRQLPGGRYDDRFRSGREQKKTVELLLKLGAKPFTGKYRDRTGE
jgi:ankyrin repeat protein